MDRTAVSDASGTSGARPSWRLKAPHDARTQALVVSGFAGLPTGRALFLRFGWDGVVGGDWLRALRAVAPITGADGRQPRAAALSFSFSGLKKMPLADSTYASFSRAFREGMFQEDRARRLGDRTDGVWHDTVIRGGPRWSANVAAGAAATAAPVAAFSVAPTDTAPPPITTELTVHAVLLLYTTDEATGEAWAAEVERALAPHRIDIVHRLPLELDLDPQGIGREHFGFADGLSQPIPYDSAPASDDCLVLSDGTPATRDKWNGVPLGDILIGHPGSHNEVSPGPVVPAETVADPAILPLHPRGEGFLDLGVDGSYMVVRELRQDVAAFWQSMHDSAARVRLRDPSASDHVDAEWLAERVIGRDRDGHLLCPLGKLKADEFGQPQNQFGFLGNDADGTGCPPGSHVRRANPRDALAPNAKMAQTMLDSANAHRILRRGRKFGPKVKQEHEDDGVDRGLLFICLNADIARQFEFIQQTWLLNPNFATLFDETDPLLGAKGQMTVRDVPLRRRVDVATFVRMAGGDYFFLPSIPALDYLTAL